MVMLIQSDLLIAASWSNSFPEALSISCAHSVSVELVKKVGISRNLDCSYDIFDGTYYAMELACYTGLLSQSNPAEPPPVYVNTNHQKLLVISGNKSEEGKIQVIEVTLGDSVNIRCHMFYQDSWILPGPRSA